MGLINSIKFGYFLISSIVSELVKNLFGIRRIYKGRTWLDGKVVVITGGNTGIGKETAFQLSLLGPKIIIGCRDLGKADNAVKDISARNPKADITVMRLDLSSLTSVRQFAKSVAEQESKIDILINNAAVSLCPEWTTEDGFEMQFGTNHLGHFLLTLSLMPLLKKASKARVINVSSGAHILGEIHFENINLRNKAYNPMKGYSQSKLANVLFTRELARRLGSNSSVNVYSLHPGSFISTELNRHMPGLNNFIMRLFYINVHLGSQTTLYCALEPSLDKESGFFYDDCQRFHKMLSKATNDRDAEKLWELSCDLVKIEDNLKIK